MVRTITSLVSQLLFAGLEGVKENAFGKSRYYSDRGRCCAVPDQQVFPVASSIKTILNVVVAVPLAFGCCRQSEIWEGMSSNRVGR